MAAEINTDQLVARRLRLGIVGIGVGASEILPQMEAMPEIQLVAAADINRRVLSTFQHRYGAKTYDSIEKLCADPNVEAIWISTPNRFHAPHAIMAAERGKHVVVEKPMAISLAEAEKMTDARPAVARMEQLYSFPTTEMQELLAGYPSLEQLIWVQEEPRNMGAWSYVEPKLRELASEGVRVSYVGRPERASPAEGYPAAHAAEQSRIVQEALKGRPAEEPTPLPTTAAAGQAKG